MRRTLLVLASLFLLGCDREPVAPEPGAEPSFQASSWWGDEVLPIDMDLYLDCLDETLHWAGPARFRYHLVEWPDGSWHVSQHAWVLDGSTLVGPVSGTWNHVRTMSNVQIVSDNTNIVERITWQNAGDGQLMDLWTRIHIVVAGNGDVKVEVLDDHTCSLRS